MSYEDSVSPECYEKERDAIFRRSWLNVGRVEQLPRTGSYFTRELAVVDAAIIVTKDAQGIVRAFHNVCRHRGNKLVWDDYPNEETCGVTRQFTCNFHAWRYNLDGSLTFVQQEQQFFDLDKASIGLAPVHCDVWEGFIFVTFAEKPDQTLVEFLGDVGTGVTGYPFGELTHSTPAVSGGRMYIHTSQHLISVGGKTKTDVKAGGT